MIGLELVGLLVVEEAPGLFTYSVIGASNQFITSYSGLDIVVNNDYWLLEGIDKHGADYATNKMMAFVPGWSTVSIVVGEPPVVSSWTPILFMY